MRDLTVTSIRQVWRCWSNQPGITLTNAKQYFSTAPSAPIHNAILGRNKKCTHSKINFQLKLNVNPVTSIMTIMELISLVDLTWSAEFIQKHKSVW